MSPNDKPLYETIREGLQSRNTPRHGTRDKINRLRVRAKEIREPELRSLFLGMLDLMADEL